MSTSSRSTDSPSRKSCTSMTSMSFASSLLTCSSVASLPRTTMVMREVAGSSVGPTLSESMLNPRPLNMPAMRVSTPNLFSTRTDSVWRMARKGGERGGLAYGRQTENPHALLWMSSACFDYGFRLRSKILDDDQRDVRFECFKEELSVRIPKNHSCYTILFPVEGAVQLHPTPPSFASRKLRVV